jgi:hypothetical protein
MTVAATSTATKTFTTDGVLSSFALTGLSFRKNADLLVRHVPTGGAAVTLSPVQYSTRGNRLAGQAVLYPASVLPAGQLRVTRKTPGRQETAFTQANVQNFKAFEEAADDLARQTRDLWQANADTVTAFEDLEDRAIAIPPGSALSAPGLIASFLAFELRFLPPSALAPATRIDGSMLQPGDEYLNTTTGLRNVWNGAQWINPTANNGAGQRGQNYAAGVDATDVTNKAQLDAAIAAVLATLPALKPRAWANIDASVADNITATYTKAGLIWTLTRANHGYSPGHKIGWTVGAATTVSEILTVTPNTFTISINISGSPDTGSISIKRCQLLSSSGIVDVSRNPEAAGDYYVNLEQPIPSIDGLHFYGGVIDGTADNVVKAINLFGIETTRCIRIQTPNSGASPGDSNRVNFKVEW